MTRLVQASRPGKVSLAGAYALGYGVLGMAQRDDDEPGWYHDLDPLNTLFLGTVWPRQLCDGYEFANARTAWLAALRDTAHWAGIERFVRETVTASEEHDLPVDDGELMLLLAGRLEAAGLDQRVLPRRLLPDTLLAGSRVALGGPPAGLALPTPLPDAAEQVARLRAATQLPAAHDGTAADALREGLGMLARAGIDVRADPVLLLPALYAALVAADHEDLREAGERAVAWAVGLPAGSPLIPVTDVLLAAPERGLDADATLARLFAIPAFSQPVPARDRGWHSWPGTELPSLAFELGHRQVTTLSGTIVRADSDTVAALHAQLRRFEEKFGRPPGPDDPIFFDPDADQPRPIPAAGLEAATVSMLEAAQPRLDLRLPEHRRPAAPPRRHLRHPATQRTTPRCWRRRSRSCGTRQPDRLLPGATPERREITGRLAEVMRPVPSRCAVPGPPRHLTAGRSR